MKKILFPIIFLSSITSVFAFESGTYENLVSSSETPFAFKSLQITKKSCQAGGVMVKFYESDAKNFCLGTESTSTFKTQKCVGYEINEFPFKKCIGFKKEVTQTTKSKVTQNDQDGSITLTTSIIVDNKTVDEESFTLLDLGNSEVSVAQAYTDKRTGTHKYAQYTYRKSN
jgi:hypothetical protein